ncbi:hypothetical protein F4824DRAFT_501946 [Ustulina deusta]|nr:hypothetical protein F4824DRAFT_501946 [Ustulina deusta]
MFVPQKLMTTNNGRSQELGGHLDHFTGPGHFKPGLHISRANKDAGGETALKSSWNISIFERSFQVLVTTLKIITTRHHINHDMMKTIPLRELEYSLLAEPSVSSHSEDNTSDMDSALYDGVRKSHHRKLLKILQGNLSVALIWFLGSILLFAAAVR